MTAPRRMRSPRTTLLAVVVALAVVATLFFKYFTGWAIYDDEGYMLVSLNGVASGHRLYTDVFSQYGPAFFLVVALPLRLLDLEWTSEAARFATVGITAAAGLVMAWSVRRITCSAALATAGGALTALTVGGEAALHPTHVLVLLIAVAVAGVVVLDDSPHSTRAVAMVGTAAALALLVKVNVGGLVVVAVVYSVADLRSRVLEAMRTCLPVVAAVGLVTLAVLSGHATRYLLALSLPTLLFTAATAARPRAVSAVSWTRLGVAAAIAAFVCVAVFVLDGTSPSALFRGVIVDPLGQADAFGFGSAISTTTYVLLGLASLSAVAARRFGLRRPSLRLAGALFVLASVAAHERFDFLTLPWDILVASAAVAALLTPTSDARSLRLLQVLAVLLPLTAYPVAGGQVDAALLPLPAFALIVAAEALAEQRFDRKVADVLAAGAAACGVLVLLVTGMVDWSSLPSLRPASLVHGNSDAVAPVARVASVLRRECDSFYSVPGLNSLYGFAGLTPPTQHNATTWMTLFDAERQAEVVRDLKRVGSLCVVRQRSLEAFWLLGGTERAGPLRAFLDEADQFVASFEGYAVYRFDRRSR